MERQTQGMDVANRLQLRQQEARPKLDALRTRLIQAAIQSFLGTAKLNGLDSHAWLKDILEKLPAWPNSRIDELLPLKVALP